MELATEALSYNNQNIASEAPKLLLCSSIASVSDQGSNKGVTPLAGIGKEHPELNWYYLYLPNKELKRYIGVFSGRKSVKLRKPSGEAEERYFCFKVFSYTSTDHRKRFEQCAYTKEKYTARRDSARVVKEAFATGSTRKLNALTDEKEIEGNGWLFVCAPLDQLELILSAMFPRQYLVTDYNTHRAAVIPQRQMEELLPHGVCYSPSPDTGGEAWQTEYIPTAPRGHIQTANRCLQSLSHSSTYSVSEWSR